MTIHTPITPDVANEAPRETEVSNAFAGLLPALAAFVQAERDLEDIGYSQDPAYGFWLRDADLAQEGITTALMHFCALPVTIAEDRPLHNFAEVIDAMLGAEEPGGARRLLQQLQVAFFTHFQVPGIGPTTLHRNSLLIQALHLTRAMIALPLFDGEELSDPDSSPDQPPGLF